MYTPQLCIVGAQKCGTSTLHASLTHHSQIRPARAPDGAVVKEVGFFDNCWDHGINWYRAHFTADGMAHIDATPNYLCNYKAHPRIAQCLPDAGLLVSLRDPIARAFSAFNHYSQMLAQTGDWDWKLPGGSFADNVEAELQQPDHNSYGLIGRSLYARQLDSLFAVFPREQVKIIVMERWIVDPGRCIASILDFMHLPVERLPVPISNQRRYTVPAMEPAVRARLRDLFRPHNEHLFELLGERIDEWS